MSLVWVEICNVAMRSGAGRAIQYGRGNLLTGPSLNTRPGQWERSREDGRQQQRQARTLEEAAADRRRRELEAEKGRKGWVEGAGRGWRCSASGSGRLIGIGALFWGGSTKESPRSARSRNARFQA